MFSGLLFGNYIHQFLDWFVTCDEKWILYDFRRRFAQWLDHNQAPYHLSKRALYSGRVMVTLWWFVSILIHHTFLNRGEMITAEKYCLQSDKMFLILRHFCLMMVNMKGRILLHNIAQRRWHNGPGSSWLRWATRPLLNQRTLLTSGPPDYHFSTNLDHFLSDKYSKNNNDTKNHLNAFVISTGKNFYSRAINKLNSRLQKCVNCIFRLSLIKIYLQQSYLSLQLVLEKHENFRYNLEVDLIRLFCT